MVSRCGTHAALGRAAPDWSPFKLVVTGDASLGSLPAYLQRVVPFVVLVRSRLRDSPGAPSGAGTAAKFRIGTGTVMSFSNANGNGPAPGWYLLTAAHVLEGCIDGEVTFFHEEHSGVVQSEGEVTMRFQLDTGSRQHRLVFSEPSSSR